ncbi:hypothetical protein [Asticcacaulis sp.]|uniref:hypothetical protein n=1 Tax=Asticcacaulis sp. TaxID=1872648 RepID=UPI0031E30F49
MHRLSASFVLAYHGCDQTVADGLLNGQPFRTSQNDYDWLGHGIYFWEANPRRGLEWAQETAARKASSIKNPAVIGAVIDLRFCLDLTTSSGILQIQSAYERLRSLYKILDLIDGTQMPRNDTRRKRHNLDCAVVNLLHDAREQENLPAFDTVKGAFLEGDAAYETSAFNTKTHIQICVRNSDCIRGVFRVPDQDLT